jgi:hypothetical protein
VVGLNPIANYNQWRNLVSVNKQIIKTTNTNMKTIILSCIAVAALFLLNGCDTEKPTSSTTTTTQQTTIPAPITTTTTDTQSK